jgi:ubiquinone/menaquinone biosynthesis C-methylase UbiE
VKYDVIGRSYSRTRRTDPRIAAAIWEALGDARTVVNVGAGTGSYEPPDRDVTAVEPSAVMIAQRPPEAAPAVQAAAEALPFADDSFDIAIFHTVLCHIPDPAAVLREARRVAPRLGAFDGDYATVTVAIADHDPLQACAEATVAGLVHDRWLVRKLPNLLEATGWTITRQGSHAYTETAQPSYALTLVDRGSGLLAAAGTIGEETAEALRAEARRRVAAGTFYGHINYASFLASASV